MISISVNTSKIDRFKLYESPKTGTKYLNLILLNQEDRFGIAWLSSRSAGKPMLPATRRASRDLERVWSEGENTGHRKEASRE